MAIIDDERDQVARSARRTAELIGLERSGDIPQDSTVLHAHLGGQPALNAYSGVFPWS